MIDRRRTLGLLVLSAAATYALLRFGVGSTPSPRHVLSWVERVGPAAAAAQMARLTAIVAGVYVASLCALALGRDLLHLHAIALPAPSVLRRLLGLGVVGALSMPAATLAAPSTTDAPVLVLVEPSPSTASSTSANVPTIVQVVPPSTATSTPMTSPPASAPPPVTEVAAASTWRVQPGDHFWGIAEQVAASRGNARDEAAVASYWRRLVDANRDRLAVADDPDLIFAGQELVLPPWDQALTR